MTPTDAVPRLPLPNFELMSAADIESPFQLSHQKSSNKPILLSVSRHQISLRLKIIISVCFVTLLELVIAGVLSEFPELNFTLGLYWILLSVHFCLSGIVTNSVLVVCVGAEPAVELIETELLKQRTLNEDVAAIVGNNPKDTKNKDDDEKKLETFKVLKSAQVEQSNQSPPISRNRTESATLRQLPFPTTLNRSKSNHSVQERDFALDDIPSDDEAPMVKSKSKLHSPESDSRPPPSNPENSWQRQKSSLLSEQVHASTQCFNRKISEHNLSPILLKREPSACGKGSLLLYDSKSRTLDRKPKNGDQTVVLNNGNQNFTPSETPAEDWGSGPVFLINDIVSPGDEAVRIKEQLFGAEVLGGEEGSSEEENMNRNAVKSFSIC